MSEYLFAAGFSPSHPALAGGEGVAAALGEEKKLRIIRAVIANKMFKEKQLIFVQLVKADPLPFGNDQTEFRTGNHLVREDGAGDVFQIGPVIAADNEVGTLVLGRAEIDIAKGKTAEADRFDLAQARGDAGKGAFADGIPLMLSSVAVIFHRMMLQDN